MSTRRATLAELAHVDYIAGRVPAGSPGGGRFASKGGGAAGPSKGTGGHPNASGGGIRQHAPHPKTVEHEQHNASPAASPAVHELHESTSAGSNYGGADFGGDQHSRGTGSVVHGVASGLGRGLVTGIPHALRHGLAEGVAHGIKQGVAHGVERGMARSEEQEKLARRNFPKGTAVVDPTGKKHTVVGHSGPNVHLLSKDKPSTLSKMHHAKLRSHRIPVSAEEQERAVTEGEHHDTHGWAEWKAKEGVKQTKPGKVTVGVGGKGVTKTAGTWKPTGGSVKLALAAGTGVAAATTAALSPGGAGAGASALAKAGGFAKKVGSALLESTIPGAGKAVEAYKARSAIAAAVKAAANSPGPRAVAARAAKRAAAESSRLAEVARIKSIKELGPLPGETVPPSLARQVGTVAASAAAGVGGSMAAHAIIEKVRPSHGQAALQEEFAAEHYGHGKLFKVAKGVATGAAGGSVTGAATGAVLGGGIGSAPGAVVGTLAGAVGGAIHGGLKANSEWKKQHGDAVEHDPSSGRFMAMSGDEHAAAAKESRDKAAKARKSGNEESAKAHETIAALHENAARGPEHHRAWNAAGEGAKGVLSGAATGAGVGATVGGAPGALIGAGLGSALGAAAGLIHGALTG